jgi:hypothetical protein
MGVRLPLTVGKAWGFPSSDVNSTTGVSFKRTGNTKVVKQERSITHAGTSILSRSKLHLLNAAGKTRPRNIRL